MATDCSELAGAVDSMALGLPPATTTNNILSTTSQRPKSLMDLPREIRDVIWTMCLHHEHVKGPPHHVRLGRVDTTRSDRTVSNAHTYRFQTAILATSRQISSEATKIFQLNQFMIISAVYPGFMYKCYTWGLPIVTQNQAHIAKFRGHILRLHVQHSQKDLAPEEKKICSILILSGDLPTFCEMMRWRMISTTAAYTIIGIPEGDDSVSERYTLMPWPVAQNFGRAKVQLQLRPGASSTLKPDLVNLLFRSLGDMMCPDQRLVGLESLAGQERVRSLKQLMAPKWVWLNAIAWSMLEMAIKLKASADALVRQGDFDRAGDKYFLLHQVTENSVLFKFPPMPEYFPPETAFAAGILTRLILDGLATTGFLYLKTGDIFEAQRAARAIQEIAPYLMQLPGVQEMGLIPEGDAVRLVHPEADWFACMLCFVMASTGKGPGAEEAFSRCWNSLRLAQAVLPESEYLEMDLKLVLDTSNSKEGREEYLSGKTELTRWLHATSAYRLPVRVVDTSLPADLKKPEKLQGLQDIEHLKKIMAKGDLKLEG